MQYHRSVVFELLNKQNYITLNDQLLSRSVLLHMYPMMYLYNNNKINKE